MDYAEMIMILSRLSIGAVATFLAIVLWSGTRDSAWMLIVMGTIVTYGQIMYSTLQMFGIVEAEFYVLAGIPIVEMLFQNLPNLFFIIAFAIMIGRNRIRYESLASKVEKKDSEEKRKKKKDKKKKSVPESAQVEEIPVEEMENLDEAAEEPGEAEAAEPVEELEEPGEAEAAEPVEELEELDEVEAAEPVEELEELGEVEEAEPVEELEELGEVEEAEPVEEVENLEEIEEAEEITD